MRPKIVNDTVYYRVTISGDCSVIPTRIPRKKAPPRRQIKCATRTGFRIDPIGHGPYAGFELDGDGRFLLGDFTVTHNTVIAAHVIQAALQRGNRCLMVAPRRELIGQTVRKLTDAGVTDVRVIQAQRDEGDPDARVIVGSIQTLTQPRWLGQLPHADLVIADEAHHLASDQWSKLASSYPAARWLGLTATPERADGRPLGDIFDDLVVAASVQELTELGCLVPCHIYAPSEELASAELAEDAVDAYQRRTPGQLAVVFCATVAHARSVAAGFGETAAVVTGQTPGAQRDDILARFQAGQLRQLCGVGVFTEGWDCPPAEVCILARKFGHAGLFLQCVGRVLRPWPGKSGATLIDLCGSVHRHKPPHVDREYSLTGRAISAIRKDSLSQCRECGSVFLSGPSVCPYCNAELPRRAATPPRVTGVGVTEFGVTPAPKREYVVSMTSTRYGRCIRCAAPIRPGEDILWATVAKQARHRCCPSGTW
jgi:superfamily II DNA or RNA helicase